MLKLPTAGMPRSTEFNAGDCLGWLSYTKQLFYLGLTSRVKNYAAQSRIKELIISQKSSGVNKSKTCITIIYTKMFHIQKDFFFLNINWPAAEVGSQSLHFFQFKMANFLINAIWFDKIYAIHSSSRKDDYYE